MSDEQEGVRRWFTVHEKVTILRGHFMDKVTVSQVCDKHLINPAAFCRWQKEFFENGTAVFQGRGIKVDGRARQLEGRVERLTARLARKDEIIVELLKDHVRLKTSLWES